MLDRPGLYVTDSAEVKRIADGGIKECFLCCREVLLMSRFLAEWQNVEAHKEYLKSFLVAAGDLDRLARFGVWCCVGLTHDESVFVFLAKHVEAESAEVRQRVSDYLDLVWNGSENSNLLSDIQQVDWDPDAVEMDGDAAAQGATDLLAGLSFLGKWCAEHNVERLVACAEVLINRIDYLESFELIGRHAANSVESEMNSQKDFVQELVAGSISDQDKRKYHEWLFNRVDRRQIRQRTLWI
ncbi:hypothetical protein [Burkholderia anthina]|uniref:hypothetical protein n=1 Tax=Burkholderia anthina TaxID=179879 RepID=UPI00158BAB8C